MSEELRVVLPHLTNKVMNVENRDVWVNDEGLTDPLTPAQYKRLTEIGYPCWTTFKFPALPPDPDAPVVLSPVEIERVRAAGFYLVPIGETVQEFLPTEADLADKGDDQDDEEEFQELGEAWLDMDARERIDAVQELEVERTGLEPVLRYLFDFEGHHLNSPDVLATIDLALQRVLPKQSAETINQALFAKSAEGKVRTKNPPSRKTSRGK